MRIEAVALPTRQLAGVGRRTGLSRHASCQGTPPTHREWGLTRTGSSNSPSHGPNEMAKVYKLGMAHLKREPRIEIYRSRPQETCYFDKIVNFYGYQTLYV